MKVLAILNPKAGRQKHKKIKAQIEAFFMKHQIENKILVSQSEEDIKNIIKQEGENYSDILIGGGDGSINIAVTGIMQMDKKPVLSVYPLGTTNDLARILSVSKNVKKNLENAFIKKRNSLIDCNKINEHYFMYVGAAGYLTNISYDISSNEKRKLGYLAYVKKGLRSLNKVDLFNVKIVTKEKTVIAETPFLIFLAAGSFGKLNLKRFEKSPKFNDGIIKLRTFIYKKNIFSRIVRFVVSHGKRHKNELSLKSDYFEIETLNKQNINWNCDGEKYVANKVKIEVIKKAFPITIGKKALKKYF